MHSGGVLPILIKGCFILVDSWWVTQTVSRFILWPKTLLQIIKATGGKWARPNANLEHYWAVGHSVARGPLTGREMGLKNMTQNPKNSNSIRRWSRQLNFFNIPKRENRETKRKENRKLDISFNMKYFVMKILQLSKEKEKKRFMLVKLADSPGHLHVHRPLKITQRNPLRWKYKTFSNKMRENVREIRKLFNWWTACYFPY